jgi:hypothetical protein
MGMADLSISDIVMYGWWYDCPLPHLYCVHDGHDDLGVQHI